VLPAITTPAFAGHSLGLTQGFQSFPESQSAGVAMAYVVGSITFGPSSPSTVIPFPEPAPSDGGKARILRRRQRLGMPTLGLKAPDGFRFREDLTMDHADPEDMGMPSDSAYPGASA
jgi:hypothetical protein